MSQTNRESTEDLDNESNDVSSESSATSTTGDGGANSVSISTGSCCSSSGSSSEVSSPTPGIDGAHVTGKDEPRNVDANAEGSHLRTKTGQKCDIRSIATNCPTTNRCDQPGPSSGEQGTRQSKETSPGPYEATSQPISNATSKLQSHLSHQYNDTQSHAPSTTGDKLDPNKQAERVDSKGFQRQNQPGSSSTSSTSIPNSKLTVPKVVNKQNDDSKLDEARRARRILRPAPSPSPSLSAIDPNNNKNNNNINNGSSSQSMRAESLSGFRRTNFSKSASGSRLMSRTPSSTRPNVCDCLAQNCGEKEHSNRRQFIEHYYNSRTRLPTSTNAMSSLNINTPLNRLSECDAITKRLLSSPIRATNVIESPTRRAQISEVDRARRASLGTNTMTDQVFLFSSNQFNSLELNYRNKSPDANEEDDDQDNQEICDEFLDNTKLIGENDIKLKQQQQQQQGRSLSVCDEDTLKPRFRISNPNHSSNLNRAVSLAYESGSSKRLLTIIPLFGCDIKTLEQFMKLGLILPPAIDSAVDHLLANGGEAVGIFRKSGVKSRILTLKQRIEANQDAKIDELNKDNEFSIYDIADLVKLWFRELKPTPLMTKESIKVISEYLQTTRLLKKQINSTREETSEYGSSSLGELSGLVERSRLTTSTTTSSMNQADRDLKNRVNSILTPGHRALFSRALSFFASIASRNKTNQMTSQNLAICLTPSLCATETDQESIITAQKALEYCIDNYRILF